MKFERIRLFKVGIFVMDVVPRHREEFEKFSSLSSFFIFLIRKIRKDLFKDF